MKLPRKSKQWLREIDKVIDDAYTELEKHHEPSKQQFEAILNMVINRIAKNRGLERTKIAVKTGEIVEALAGYLKSIPDTNRDWPNIVTFLYIKFHQALGIIDEQQILKILFPQFSDLDRGSS